ncbi:NEFA-interacting nuclear protein NIP30 [Niveomyces insectorum RCEF 264]|uniref:NEFA-interacting nuclear protein NIP30 n=1 Tax=Niveomyces insectorum RCEF 264 TaxID=1081102 RepID=A0A167UQ65_9HYPO|nr:NEFA-interacting nuclear protein NIP30 [Niveomyces insectorum RCEF 264]
MSSRFVSGGAINAASGDAVTPPSDSPAATRSTAADAGDAVRRQAQWEAVERELEEERRKRAEARRAANSTAGEPSLYEVLQANKASKQAAFEEAHRLKNQFRALDEDEVDFLDGVLAASRAEEARVRQETQAGLDAFRQAQRKTGREGGGGSNGGAAGTDEGNRSWQVAGGRKRKRHEDKKTAAALLGVKRKSGGSTPAVGTVGTVGQDGSTREAVGAEDDINKTRPPPHRPAHASAASGPTLQSQGKKQAEPAATAATAPKAPTNTAPAAAKPASKLGLVEYGSDEDDDVGDDVGDDDDD